MNKINKNNKRDYMSTETPKTEGPPNKIRFPFTLDLSSHNYNHWSGYFEKYCISYGLKNHLHRKVAKKDANDKD